MESFLHTTFIPSCADIEQYAPEEAESSGMYKPFPKIEPPKDPVTQEQLDKFNAKVREICEGKVIVKIAEHNDVKEKISQGMKAKFLDRKAEAANDK